jgi:N-acetylated-alpha-linked acidic dipeptidase
MRRMACLVLLLSACAVTASGQPAPGDAAAIARFDENIHPAELDGWLKLLAAEPNHVSSPHDKSNAEWILRQFQNWGWSAHIETFKVLYPTPVSESLDMGGWKATLQEMPIAGDTSATAQQPVLPAYVEYQGDGDVTAPLVYVNYGNVDDFRRLEQEGISVKGKIVIARYGKGWRGLKPQLAQAHGAIGTLIYSDPAEDGYSTGAAYPDGPARPPQGIQRGSVENLSFFQGDPLTPGVGATENAKRLTRETSPVILKIPTLPISYADAQVLLAAMDGKLAPESWRGHLPITYRIDGTKPVHLMVKSEWSLKTIYDVIATIKGSTYPDQWVIRGNHHDGWVFGASDPLSGQIAELAEAQAIGALVKSGWKPKRTLVYASWDAEEPGLLGSTEWAETHAEELRSKAFLYVNSDANGRGTLHVGGNEDLEKFVDRSVADLHDPEVHVSVNARRRAKMRLAEEDDHAKALAHRAADPAKDLALEPLGSGSDYAAFIHFLGVPVLDYGFSGEGSYGGVYHSRYDTYEHHTRFADPGLVYDALLAKTVGRAVIDAADADLPLQNGENFADATAQYVIELKKLAADKKTAAQNQKSLLAGDVYAVAEDPTKPRANPIVLADVPDFDFSPLDQAIATLRRSAAAYDQAMAMKGAGLSPADRKQLMTITMNLDRTLLYDGGLPERGTWYRNLIYAPGRFTGYGSKTMPGIREALEEERWSDAGKYIGLTAGVLNGYSAQLDKATALLGR